MPILTNTLITLVVFLLFGVVVFAHELGHYLAARWLGFHVEAFAIGFGPAIWKRKIGQTWYRLNWIPFGGYCALPQLDPSGMEKIQGSGEGENANDAPQNLPDMAPWRRIVVAIAGPAGNVALAVLAAVAIWLFAPPSAISTIGTQIGYVDKASDAWAAGLREGQTLLKVGGSPVRTWDDFLIKAHIAADAGELVALTVGEEDGATRVLEAPLTQFDEIRIVKGVAPNMKFSIAEVEPGGPADLAGVKEGDRVLMLNDKAVLGDFHFIGAVAKNGEKPLVLTLLRGGREVAAEMTPVFDPALERARIGVKLDASGTAMWMKYRDPCEQLESDAGSVFLVLKALTAPKAKGDRKRVAGSLGGPPAILNMFWVAVLEGFWACLGFVRLICVNLAIINLLPIPVLDGGHVCFALWEVVTRRKPHPKVVAALVNTFAVLLIAAMLFLTFRDTWKLWVKKWVVGRAPVERVE